MLEELGFNLGARAFSLRKIKSVLPDNISISTSLHSGLGMKVAFSAILENNWKMKLTWYLKHYKDLGINNYYVGISPTPHISQCQDFRCFNTEEVDQIKDFAFIFFCFMSSDPIQSLIAQEKLSTIKRAIKIKDYNNRSVVFTKINSP